VIASKLRELNYQVMETIRNHQSHSAEDELAVILRCPVACISSIRRLTYELMIVASAVESSLLQIELHDQSAGSAWALNTELAMAHLLLIKRAGSEGNTILMALKFNCAADLVERIAAMSEQQLRDALQAGQLQLHFNEAAQQHLDRLLSKTSPTYQRTCRMTEMLTCQVDDLAVH